MFSVLAPYLQLVIAWFVSMLGLSIIGVALSWFMLKEAEKAQFSTQSVPIANIKFIRSLYRFVIGALSLYFYLSIPMVILIVVVMAVVVFYLLLPFGGLSIISGVFSLGLIVYTVIAFVRGIFARTPTDDFGRPVSADEAPLLWSCITDAAEKLNTRSVDAVYITPDTSIGVVERGGLFKRLFNKGERCLVLGLGVLPEMTVNQFQSILAHEYGHFLNRDTAGTLTRRVRLTIGRTAESLHKNGQAGWYNPAWLYVTGFYRLFLFITRGSSRVQEVLADKLAASIYGAQDLIDALIHVAAQDLAFYANAQQKSELSARLNRSNTNFYQPVELPDTIQARLDSKLQTELARDTSFLDSHPALKIRISYLTKMAEVADAAPSEAENRVVWVLFDNAEEIQNEMSSVLQKRIELWDAEQDIWEAQLRWGDFRWN